MLLASVAGFVKDLMGLARGQPLIPQVNRQSRQCAEFGGKSLGLGGLRAHIARQVHRVAHHDARRKVRQLRCGLHLKATGKTRSGKAVGRPRRDVDLKTIRPAAPADVPQILEFIRGLATYEREPDAVVATEADLLRDGFGPDPRFRALIADVDGAPAGFALFFTSYSTWRGHHGIRLEDLYVTPELRGQGIGKALLARVAQIAVAEGCPRLEWDVLDWNAPAIAVYERLGAHILTEWRIMRLSGDALTALAAQST